jgi:hypothetical protein
MALLIIALALFLGMVVAWIVLPGGAVSAPAQESMETRAGNAVGQTA